MKKPVTLLLLSASLFLAACSDGGKTTPAVDPSAITIVVAGPTSVEVGKTIKLNITLTNDSERLGFDVESSDPTIASVDGEGRVTGKKVGNVIITASSSKDPSVKATYEIEVTESSVPTLSLHADRDIITLGSGTLTFTANLNNPTPYTPEYLWESVNGNISPLGARNPRGTFQTVSAGGDTVKLTVHVGPYLLSAQTYVVVQPNYEDGTWLSITDKDTFVSKLLTNNTVTGNFALDADIDLEGMEIPKSGRTFAGVLEGKGHTISNFKVHGVQDGNIYNSAGMWNSVTGAIRDTAFDGEIDELGSGWGGALIAAEAPGVFENLYVHVNHSFDNGQKQKEGWVAFNAALVGVAKEGGRFHDLVIEVADNEGKATCYADTAYPAGKVGAQTFKFDNLYTNSTVVGGQTWDWGDAVSDLSGYYTGINFAGQDASLYRLNPTLWNLESGVKPTLKVRE